MSGWDWEYLSDAEHVVGGLSAEARAEVERIAERLADAAAVKYLGDPPPEEAGVAPLVSIAEGLWMIWYQEYRVRRVVYIVLTQHLGS
ncbi:hypothetical protein [Streptomyces sp. NRRL B-1347]|uniref:hypothetical protein n=1 Tax=Streptomyces sp. NRRL B-1347 TaxID=1476877 RepID=UPI0004CB74C8|nr:hypothetical protein [Streptomyces sp. NRRL B-1347]